ncbi:uncharacterized protein [Notamacropus eugenii]|uniref:uncharacterized protein isoform X2 n=1 Tax=Notamacropus eugenii TaxID=9315 RepID=UPI003B684E86
MEGAGLADPGVEMSSLPVPKVVFKNTTKMSLNERFTEVLTSKQPVRITIRQSSEQQEEREQQDQPSSSARSSSKSSRSTSFQRYTSSEERKITQEMESSSPEQELFPLKADRVVRGLGKRNVHSRLGWPYQAKRAVGSWKGSWGRDASHGESSGGRGFSRAAGAQEEMQGGWVSRPHRRWLNRETQSPQSRSALPHGNVRKSGVRRGFGWRGSSVYREVTTGGYRGRGSSMGGRGRGSFEYHGQRQGHSASRAPLTKEQLDDQLDSYMATSRGRLDAELRAYMSQTN